MDINKIRQDFPVLQNTDVRYFDSTATALKPKQVIDAIMEYYNYYGVNVHRGLYKLSQKASQKFEEAHDKVRKFINASSKKEILLCNNTTEAVNEVACGLKFEKGQNVITSPIEHHSNFLPWLRLKRKGVEVRFIDVSEEGVFNLDDLNEKIDKNTRIVSFSGGSNVLGQHVPVKEMCKIVHDNGTLAMIDAAQLIPHKEVDVKDLDVDFMAFSGHKMLGPTGTGILYVKEELLDELEPLNVGGGGIVDVTLDDYKLAESPDKYEAGTPNVSGMIGLGAAADYLKNIGMKNVEEYEHKLLKKMLKGLDEMENVEYYGPKDPAEKIGVISFNVKGMDAHDVALIFDQHKFAVRSGHHCVMPWHKKMGLENSIRASLYIYNTEQELDEFFEVLEKITKLA